MIFSGSLMAIFLHVLITLIISFFIPLLEPFSRKDISQAVVFVATVLIIGNVVIAVKSRIEKKKFDVFQHLDLSIFLSIWTGVNQLAFKTRYPPVSARYYPEISKFFPAFFIFGFGLIVFITSCKQLKFAHKAWLVVFMVTSLPYTHPLDHYTLALCFPLMLLLYAVHRDTKNIGSSFHNPFFRFLFVTAFCFFLFQLFLSLRNDFDQAVPDILFYAILPFIFLLVWGAIKCDEEKMYSIVKKAVASHVVLMLCLALVWIVWTASRLGVFSILKYRLWISLIHPNALAAYMAASFLILEPWKKRSTKHAFIKLISVCALIMLILTQSRGMIFALVLSFLIVNFNIFRLFRKLEINQKRFVLYAVSASVILAVIIYRRVHYRLLTIQMVQDRMALWKAGWDGIKTHLWSGFGFGSKQLLAAFVIDPFSSNTEFLRLWMDWDRLGKHFHSLLIELLWLFGLPGLLLLLFILYGCFYKKELKKVYPGIVMAILALLIFGFFDCPIYYSAIMFLGTSLLGVLSGSSIQRKAGDNSRQTAHKTASALPAVLAVGVLLLIVIPALHQRFLFAWGIHQSNHGSDKSKASLASAAFYRPPSGKAVEKLVKLMLDEGNCINAISVLDTYMSRTDMPKIQLMRLHAWLEQNQDQRLKRLLKAWQSDPSGLISENLYFEAFLVEIQSEFFEMRADILDNLLADRNFYLFLRDHGIETPEGLKIDKKAVNDILLARGLHLSSCKLKYSSVVIPLEDLLTTIETMLSRCDANIIRCNKKRQAYFLALLKARDFGRATRVANSWNFDLAETRLMADIQTFQDGSSAYSIIQAHKAIGNRDYALAEHLLLSASAEEKSNPEWFYMMSIVWGEKDNWQAALKAIDSALQFAPFDVRFLMEKGKALYHLGQLNDALLVFQTILNFSPWSVNAQSYTGIILYKLERIEEAVLYFKSALDLTPEDPQAYFNLYMALTALPARSEDAKKLHDTMIEKFGDAAIFIDEKEGLFAGNAGE